MVKSTTLLTVRQGFRFLGVADNTLRNWDSAGTDAVHRHPRNRYRLFDLADLERIRNEIEQSGTYPSGWQRSVKPK